MDNKKNDNDDEHERVHRRRPWALISTAGIVLLFGVVVLASHVVQFIIHGEISYWKSLNEPQSGVLVALVTVYAAALAATLGPLIYTLRIEDLRSSNEAVVKEMQGHVNQLLEQVDLVRRHVKKMRDETIGDDANLDIVDIRLEMENIQQTAETLSKNIILNSRKWKKKQEYSGLWPGRTSWINLLYEHELIDDVQWDLFDQIHQSRQYTKPSNPSTPDIHQLQTLRESLERLQKSLVPN